MKLGTLDPTFRYHAGIAAIAAARSVAAGRRDRLAAEGRRDLRLALRRGLDAHPLHADRARAALENR